MQPQNQDTPIRIALVCIVILFAGVIFYVHHVTVTREASATSNVQPTKYKNNIYEVSLEFPADWQPVDQNTFNSYSGGNGFFTLEVSNAKNTSVASMAQKDIADVAHVYGSAPTTSSLVVDGQSAVLITPSGDQDSSLRGQAELIVNYPALVTISGQVYTYLILQDDKTHIVDIARSLVFTTN
jgi:hypothetical protein